MSIKLNRGTIFSERERGKPAAEEANPSCNGKNGEGETFRQKDREMDHILNLVLYDKTFEQTLYYQGKRQKKDDLHTCSV